MAFVDFDRSFGHFVEAAETKAIGLQFNGCIFAVFYP